MAYDRKMRGWILTSREAADIADVDIRTVQRAVLRGELKTICWEGSVLVLRGIDVLEWANSRTLVD